MFHLSAWYGSIDPAGSYIPIPAVQDPAIRTSGDDIRVNAELPTVMGASALTGASVLTASQLRSPSLRTLNNLFIRPLVNAVVFPDPPVPMMFPYNPRPMDPAEDVQCWINSTPAAGAEAHYGLVWFADGPQQIVSGEIFTAGATSTISLSAGVWVNGEFVFDQKLASGSYQIVGFRPEGPNLVCARIVYPGGGANAWRPGAPATVALGTQDPEYFRFGRLGVWGVFDQDNQPTIDCLGVTDTSQTLTFDLIKIA